MPQLITHNIFAKDVYDKLDKDVKKSIEKSIPVYEMYAQSFDTFIYYLSLSKKVRETTTKLRKWGHKKNVKKYFMNIIKNIEDMKLQDDKDALAYLFGSIDHYILDSTCHPLIFYKTGVPRKRIKESKKYIGLHMDMETHIDAFYYINRYKKSFHKVNTTKEFIPKLKYSKTLELIMNKTILDTFKIDNAYKYYYKAYNNSRWLYPLFVNDKHRIKLTLYKIYDKLFFFSGHRLKYLSTYIKQPKISYLNIEHKKWCYPSDKSITSTESFIDLYNKSVDKAVYLINTAYKVLHGKLDIKEFESTIGNLSYVRGLDCDNSTYMKYFEF